MADILKRWFGWRSVTHLGDISAARATEQMMPIWLRLYAVLGTLRFNLEELLQHQGVHQSKGVNDRRVEAVALRMSESQSARRVICVMVIVTLAGIGIEAFAQTTQPTMLLTSVEAGAFAAIAAAFPILAI